MNNPYLRGGDMLSGPVDLNQAQPVQYMADGGFLAPPQQAVVYRPGDKEYLAQRQKEAEAYEAQRQAYNTALERYRAEQFDPYQAQVNAYNEALNKYNTEVYEPYKAAYGEYERAVNTWNEGSRESDYAGPAEPTLTPFSMQAPVAPKAFEMATPKVPFDPEAVAARQAEAARIARQDAAARGTGLSVVNDPRQFNVSSFSRPSAISGMSVPGYAIGGLVKPKTFDVDVKAPEVLTSKQMLRKLKNKTQKFADGGEARPSAADVLAQLKQATGRAPAPAEGRPTMADVNATLQQALLAGPQPQPQPQVQTQPQPQPAPRDNPYGVPDVSNVPTTVEAMTKRIGELQQQLEGMPATISRRKVMGGGRATVANPARTPLQQELDQLIGTRKLFQENEARLKAEREGSSPGLTVRPEVLPPKAPSTPGVYSPDFMGPLPEGAVRAPRPDAPRGSLPMPAPGTPIAPLPTVPDPFAPPPSTVTPTIPAPVIPTPNIPKPGMPTIPTPAVPTPSLPTFGKTPQFFNPPAQGSAPGTVSIGQRNPYVIQMGQTALDLLQQSPNLAPKTLGGQQNLGFMTDRLGNVIRTPGMPPPLMAFADGGLASRTAALNAYNLSDEEDEPILTDPVGTARQMLQEFNPQTTTEYEETPKKVSMKRVSKTPMASPSGSAKGMKMELDEISAMKMPKDLKAASGLSRSELEELAREYGLKRAAALDTAKGLMRATFEKPTLEKSSLTKGSLTKRRFEEGGEVKKDDGAEEESSAPDMFKSGGPVYKGKRPVREAPPRAPQAPQAPQLASEYTFGSEDPYEFTPVGTRNRMMRLVRSSAPPGSNSKLFSDPQITRSREEFDQLARASKQPPLPPDAAGMFDAFVGPRGAMYASPLGGSAALTHEAAHAADYNLRGLYRQAIESRERKSNPAAQQFADAYEKLVGGKEYFGSHESRKKGAETFDAEWVRENKGYRSHTPELVAFAMENAMGGDRGQMSTDRAPLHMDPTLATEFTILTDLAQKYVDSRTNKPR